MYIIFCEINLIILFIHLYIMMDEMFYIFGIFLVLLYILIIIHWYLGALVYDTWARSIPPWYMIFGRGPFRLGLWYLGKVHSALVYDIWARSIPSWFMIFMDEVYSVLFLRHVHYILLFEFLDFKLWKWCLWIWIAIYNYALVILLTY